MSGPAFHRLPSDPLVFGEHVLMGSQCKAIRFLLMTLFRCHESTPHMRHRKAIMKAHCKLLRAFDDYVSLLDDELAADPRDIFDANVYYGEGRKPLAST